MAYGVEVELLTDNSAAKGIGMRRGLGQVRHMKVCYLWLQEKFYQKMIRVYTVGAKEHLADVPAKYATKEEMQTAMSNV